MFDTPTTRRRVLGQGLAAVAGLAGLGAAARAWGEVTGEPTAPPDPATLASEVYARALPIDAMATDGPFFDPKEAVAAGLTAVVADLRLYPRTFQQAVDALAAWNDAFRRPDSNFLKVLRAADLEEAKRLGKLGIVLACQDGSILDVATYSVNDRNLRNLRFFHELGLRVLQLTHNERNALADSFRERSDAGLSLLGERVVAEMNALGMLIDLSHCGDRTTLEAIRLSSKPCAVTHAGCRALYPTGRNKTDQHLRALADRGGFFGVFSMSMWLTDRDTSSVEDVLDHIDHAVGVGGIDLVGFGSDGPVLADDTPPEVALQGIAAYVERNAGLPGSERMPKHVAVAELNTPRRLALLAGGLARRGYAEDAIEKVLGRNFARVFAEACG